MPERKMRLLKVMPALLGVLASSLLAIPIRADVRDALMGLCIGLSIVCLAALARAQRC